MRNLIFVILMTVVGTANADFDRTYGINLLFNTKGMQGVGFFINAKDVQLHAVQFKNVGDYAVGVGVNLDPYGNGTANDENIEVSASGGVAYIGGRNSGFRPYGQINVQGELNDDINLTVGGISYGLGVTHTDDYGYVGMNHEHLINNSPAENTSAPVTDTSGTVDDTSGSGSDDTGGNGNPGNGNGDHGNGNPGNGNGDHGNGNPGNGNGDHAGQHPNEHSSNAHHNENNHNDHRPLCSHTPGLCGIINGAAENTANGLHHHSSGHH